MSDRFNNFHVIIDDLSLVGKLFYIHGAIKIFFRAKKVFGQYVKFGLGTH